MKKIGILCASDDELAPFLPRIRGEHLSRHAMLTFHEGNIDRTQVVALYSGVCKVNAALAAQILIDRYRVDAILSAGTAGGMDPAVQLLDTVVSTHVAYHDVADDILTEFHPWMSSIYFEADAALLAAARAVQKRTAAPLRFGRTVTGEQFISERGREEILSKYAPLAVDMESAGIAHVCYVNRIPFLSLRAVTDTADHAGLAQFEQNCAAATKRSAEIVLLLLEELEQRSAESAGAQ